MKCRSLMYSLCMYVHMSCAKVWQTRTYSLTLVSWLLTLIIIKVNVLLGKITAKTNLLNNLYNYSVLYKACLTTICDCLSKIPKCMQRTVIHFISSAYNYTK